MDLTYGSVDAQSAIANKDFDDHLEKLSKHPEDYLKLERLVEKNGKINILTKPSWRVFNPFDFSNLIEMGWASFLFLSASAYFISFYVFGGLFLMLEEYHRHLHKEDHSEESLLEMNEGICYQGVHDVTSAILLAIETAQTIGYGTRYPNTKCPDGVLVILLSIFWSTFLGTLFIGIFVSKFSHKSHYRRISFSTKALVTIRNGSLYLVLRVADPFNCEMDYGAEAQAILIFKDNLDLQFEEVTVGCQLDGTNHHIPLMWPCTVSHKIDINSPLYQFGPDMIGKVEFELIVFMSGDRLDTGSSVECMTSYTSREVVWGARFCHTTTLTRGKENKVSCRQEDIDMYEMDNTPRVSAMRLGEMKNSEEYIVGL
jgi:hypothetical protein